MNNFKTVFRIKSPKIFYSKPADLEKTNPPDSISVLIKHSSSSEVLVKAGDDVKTCQKIGVSDKRPVFSSITGKVKFISEMEWTNNESFHAVEIERSGNDEWEQLFQPADPPSLDRNEILSRLDKAGFNTDAFESGKPDKVIINCCEYDVFTSNVQASVLDRKELFLKSVGFIRKITGCENILITAQSGFEKNIKEITDARIKAIKPVYPFGMDDLLPLYMKETGNITVVKADILLDMMETIKTGLPPFERIVTLIGNGNKPLKNIKVRLGSKVSGILDNGNIQHEDASKIILGGGMLGTTVFDKGFPVRIDTNGISMQSMKDVIDISPEACLNCGECIKICPKKLQANMLSRYSEFNLFEKCKDLDINECVECGMCAFVCISHRPMVQYMQFAKNQLSIIESKEETSNDN